RTAAGREWMRFARSSRLGRRRFLRFAMPAASIGLAACATPLPPTSAPAAPPPTPEPSPSPAPSPTPVLAPTTTQVPPATPSAAANPSSGGAGRISDRLFPELIGFVEAGMARLGVPGVAVGILDGGVE